MAKISSARLDMEGGRLDNVQLKHYGETMAATVSTTTLHYPAQMSERVWAEVSYSTGSHGTAVSPGGQLWAWGFNSSGQLGDLSVATRSSPVQVGADKVWAATALGTGFSLARTTSGQLWAWGVGTGGLLGTNDVVSRSSPVQVASDKTWAGVAIGGVHTAAVTTSGQLWAWGTNSGGQLGQVTHVTVRSSPVQVASDKTWAVAAAGSAHTVGITTVGQLWAWGTNSSGQLGQITNIASTSSPVQVASDKTWSSVACGAYYNIALTTTGQLWAWGSGSNGTLGQIANVTNMSSPVQVASDKTWAAVAAGNNHTLALSASGQLWAWGLATSGQLGQLSGLTARSSPVQVGPDKTWAKMSGGSQNTGALTTTGLLYTFGSNSVGQTGNPAVPTVASTVIVDLGISNVWRVVLTSTTNTLEFRNAPSGRNTSLTLFLEQDFTGGRPISWPGYVLWSGGLPPPALTTVPGRVDVFHFTTNDGGQTWLGYPGARNLTTTDLSTARIWTAGTTVSGSLGLNDVLVHPSLTGVPLDSPPAMVAAGGTNTAVVTTGGQLWMWGLGSTGALGQVTAAVNRSSPVQVGANKTWSSVSVMGAFTVGITTSGQLWGWGTGTAGQLGQVTNVTNTSSPVQIASDKTWSSAFASFNHTLGITSTGQLWAWGTNTNGQLGQVTNVTNRSSPVQIASDKTWSTVSSSLSHVAAVTSDGQLWMWGANGSGQLGQNSAVPANASSPVQVASDKTWAMVAAAGNSHTMAITTNGQLWAWGGTSVGQLGENAVIPRSSPVQIASGKTWAAVAAVGNQTAAITTNGQLWAWGTNTSGQIGLGFNIEASSPVQIGGAGITWSQVAMGNSHIVAIST